MDLREASMSMESKKSIGTTVILMIFGVLAMYAGLKSLVVLIPAAVLIWHEARPQLGSGRN
jgi:p-aminobenzoyl-glutamate transporter AbgT